MAEQRGRGRRDEPQANPRQSGDATPRESPVTHLNPSPNAA